jgi:hypothetical protein
MNCTGMIDVTYPNSDALFGATNMHPITSNWDIVNLSDNRLGH